MDRREDGSFCTARVWAEPLRRRLASLVAWPGARRGRRGPKGLRAVSAPSARQSPRVDRGPMPGRSCAAPSVSVNLAWRWTNAHLAAGLRRALRALETVEKVL